MIKHQYIDLDDNLLKQMSDICIPLFCNRFRAMCGEHYAHINLFFEDIEKEFADNEEIIALLDSVGLLKYWTGRIIVVRYINDTDEIPVHIDAWEECQYTFNITLDNGEKCYFEYQYILNGQGEEIYNIRGNPFINFTNCTTETSERFSLEKPLVVPTTIPHTGRYYGKQGEECILLLFRLTLDFDLDEYIKQYISNK